MAKPRPEKKRKRAPPAKRRVLPMELRIGDRLIDKSGEWEVIGPLYRSSGGKNAAARLRKVGQPDLTAIRTWGAHERIAVRRVTAEEGKR